MIAVATTDPMREITAIIVAMPSISSYEEEITLVIK